MKPMYKTIPLALAASALFTSATQATVVSVNFTNADGPRKILATESTGVINAKGWVNMKTATKTNINGTPIDITLSAVAAGGWNTARDAKKGDGTNGFLALYEAGVKDNTPNKPADSFVTIKDMTAFLKAEGATSYTIYVYYKSTATLDKDNIALGLDSKKLTTYDPIGVKVSASDSFVAGGKANSNYVVYSGLTADSTTIFINRVQRDAMLTGIQIVAKP